MVSSPKALDEFQQRFQVLPDFHECFLTPQKHGKHIFYFFKKRTPRGKIIKSLARLFSLSKCRFSWLAPSLRKQLVLVLCFYQVIVI